MPELPEVETICQGLRKQMINKIIAKVQILTRHSLRQPIPANITKDIIQAKVIQIFRRAKYIQIILDNSLIVLIHLGMSGKILIKDQNYHYQKHDHLAIHLEEGLQIVYQDPRRFGLINLLNKLDLEKFLANMGIEPLSNEFTDKYLASVLYHRKQPIKLALMDNQMVVGIGNIYASESLFLSKILPTRSAGSLDIEEIKLLHSNIIKTLQEAIKQGGSSLKDYANVSGEKGYFQHYFKVYGRIGKECTSCNAMIVKITQAGRASFYCPVCQK